MLKQLSVDPKTLKKNKWNTNIVSPENETKLDASLSRLGVFKPIICRELDDGSLEIIGGEHRAESAVRLKIKEVPVINLGALDDQRAKEIMLTDNGRYGTDDTLQLAALLEGLGDIGELASFMPFSDSDLHSIFSSTSIALDELDIADDEELAPSHTPAERPTQIDQLMRFKIPLGDVAAVTAVIESIMKSQKFDKEDSLSNAGHALVYLCHQED